MGVRACSLRVDGRGSGCRLCNFRVWGQRLVGRVRIENTVRRERNHLSIAYIHLQQLFFSFFFHRLDKSYPAGCTCLVGVRLCVAAKRATPLQLPLPLWCLRSQIEESALHCRSFSLGISPPAHCRHVLFLLFDAPRLMRRVSLPTSPSPSLFVNSLQAPPTPPFIPQYPCTLLTLGTVIL